MATRLFKYLLKDYYEEFCTNVTNWVAKSLKVVEHAEAERTLLGRGGQDVQNLRELYTQHVVPDTMMDLWNVGTGDLVHRLAPGAEALASRPALVSQFTTFIVKCLLTPDEAPTLTRFFSFRKVIDAMLTMDIIGGLPHNLFTMVKIKPQPQNQKRLKLVTRFFERPAAKQALRRASLVLQLTGGLEAITASKAKEGELPRIVALVKGEAHTLVVKRLQRLFAVMHKDPLLELGPAATNILGTAADLILRFNKMLRYPFILCRLCKLWFPLTYLNSIMQFLHEESAILDVGVSMQLRDIALEGRSESQALAWMMSEAVQELLEQICKKLVCHSLDVERKAAQVKRWETTKVTHIATASQNNISARFAKEREEKSLAIERALKALRRAQKMRITSYNWTNERPDGIRFKKGNTFNSSSDTCGAQTHPLGSGQSSGVKRGLNQEKEQLDQLAAEKERLVMDAKLEVDRLLQCCMVPVTRSQWGAWLDDNIAEFRQRMTTACTDRRKQNSRSAACFLDIIF